LLFHHRHGSGHFLGLSLAHFGGVPGSIVYDRTKTVIKRHVAPKLAVPLHPEAAAFAEHYRFSVDVLAAYRPTGKGRVERQVNIVRDHVIAGRRFDSLAELDGAFHSWLPIRRAQVHRTHGEVIAVRAEADRAALGPLPERPYLVAEKHLRRVGKDCLVWFEASLYSVPARQVRPGQRVQLHIGPDPAGDRIHLHAWPWTAAAGWPPTPAPPGGAPGWSTLRIGMGCLTAIPAAPQPRLPDRAGSTRRPRRKRRSRWLRC
jgi:Mu transposase, C-terminal domain